MKKLITLFSVLCLSLAFAGCSNDKPVPPAELLNHNFVLSQVDGKAYENTANPDAPIPNVSFVEGMRIMGGMCNQFNGAVGINTNTLTARNVAVTKMSCDEQLNKLEGDFIAMLEKGANITLVGEKLTFKDSKRTFEFTRKDPVQ